MNQIDDTEYFKKQYANVDPVDYYLLKQKALEIRIVELQQFIRRVKGSQGLVRHRNAEKIRNARRMIEQLEQIKEDDCMPWEQGHTYYFSVLGVEL